MSVFWRKMRELGRVLQEAGFWKQPDDIFYLDRQEVRDALIPLRTAAKGLGVTLAEPFLQVAFLPLPVIPHLKITDMGLVDVDKFAFVRD